jgi:hypothetical protein
LKTTAREPMIAFALAVYIQKLLIGAAALCKNFS